MVNHQRRNSFLSTLSPWWWYSDNVDKWFKSSFDITTLPLPLQQLSNNNSTLHYTLQYTTPSLHTTYVSNCRVKIMRFYYSCTWLPKRNWIHIHITNLVVVVVMAIVVECEGVYWNCCIILYVVNSSSLLVIGYY